MNTIWQLIVMIMISYEVECGIMINGESSTAVMEQQDSVGQLQTTCNEEGEKIAFGNKVSQQIPY